MVHEKLDIWVDKPSRGLQEDSLTLSNKAKKLSAAGKGCQAIADPREIVGGDPELFLMKEIIEALTGREIRILDLPEIGDESSEVSPDGSEPSSGPERAGWGLRYEYQESRMEKEETRFTAAGVVKTADGAEIKFSIDLLMSREFFQSTRISIRAGDALRVDPLVINFSGTAAQLTDQRFAFDLNSDGRDESIPVVAGGSGILVFDKNEDHQVNNGRELFGPNTGNGFAELSLYDEDGNRWIDESDAIYKNLYVWTRGPEGDNYLQGLKERGIGAISVAGIDSSFALKDSNNGLKGEITGSGIYLAEGGHAGTIQQLDVFI